MDSVELGLMTRMDIGAMVITLLAEYTISGDCDFC